MSKPEVAEQADHIARPADRDDRSGKPIFEDQERAHDPGGELADRGIAVGVSGPRNRQGRGQLGVAQAGEGADDPGDDVGEQHGRAGVERRGVAGADEDAGADDAADAEEDQVPWPQGALEFAGPGFFLDVGDALAQPDPAQKAPASVRVAMVNLPLKYCFVAAEPSASNGAGNPYASDLAAYRANIGPSGSPPKMWTWRWPTSWPERLPVLASRR